MASTGHALVVVIGLPGPRRVGVLPAIEPTERAGDPPSWDGRRDRPADARGGVVDLYA